MLFIILVLLIALGVLSPYIAVTVKRRRMLRRLVRVARQAGFRPRRLHRFVCLSFNRGRKYDLLFECKTHCYAVKLWSAVRKNTTLVLKNGCVSETATLYEPLMTGKREQGRAKGREKRVPVTVNNFKVSRGKPVTGVLLFYPPYREITVEGVSRRKTLSTGDKMFDKIICFPGGFEEMLGTSRDVMTVSDVADDEAEMMQTSENK